MEPKISVIMGIYNCASTLPDAIISIQTQTVSDWEFIMCDDGSSDERGRLPVNFSGTMSALSS